MPRKPHSLTPHFPNHEPVMPLLAWQRSPFASRGARSDSSCNLRFSASEREQLNAAVAVLSQYRGTPVTLAQFVREAVAAAVFRCLEGSDTPDLRKPVICHPRIPRADLRQLRMRAHASGMHLPQWFTHISHEVACWLRDTEEDPDSVYAITPMPPESADHAPAIDHPVPVAASDAVTLLRALARGCGRTGEAELPVLDLAFPALVRVYGFIYRMPGSVRVTR